MAKRFTETAIWQDEWFMELPPDYKLAYMFLKDNCDCAGIWKPNKRLAVIMIGCPIDWEDFFNQCDGRIKIIQGGYWWLTKFVDFQYGTLSENCKPHTKVFEALRKYDLLKRVNKGYPKGTSTLEDKEEDKDKEEEEEKEKDVKIIFPFSTEKFEDAWGEWKAYKLSQHAFKYKTAKTEQTALNELLKLSKGKEFTALEIIQRSIANGWKGFFEIKPNNNGQNNKYEKPTAEDVLERIRNG
jgi:hypothetical protein